MITTQKLLREEFLRKRIAAGVAEFKDYGDLAEVLWHRGHKQKIPPLLQQALNSSPSAAWRGMALSALAWYSLAIFGESVETVSQIKTALATLEDCDATVEVLEERAYCTHFLTQLFLDTDPDLAIGYASRCLSDIESVAQRGADPDVLLDLFIRAAEICNDLQQLDKALLWLQRMREIGCSADDETRLGECLYRGRFLRVAGKLEDARTALDEASPLLSNPEPSIRREYSLEVAYLRHQQGEFANAAIFYEALREEHTPDVEQYWKCTIGLGICKAHLGGYEEGERLLSAAAQSAFAHLRSEATENLHSVQYARTLRDYHAGEAELAARGLVALLSQKSLAEDLRVLALLGLGHVYFHLWRFEEARHCYREVAEKPTVAQHDRDEALRGIENTLKWERREPVSVN